MRFGFVRKRRSPAAPSATRFRRDQGRYATRSVEISLAFATTVFTNVFNRINDTEIDCSRSRVKDRRIHPKDHDHDYAFQHHSKCPCPRAAQVWPPCRGSRLPRRPGLDGDHVPLLRLSEVVSVRVRKIGPLHQQRTADLVAVSGFAPRRRKLLPRRLGVDLHVPAARGLLGQAARRFLAPSARPAPSSQPSRSFRSCRKAGTSPPEASRR